MLLFTWVMTGVPARSPAVVQRERFGGLRADGVDVDALVDHPGSGSRNATGQGLAWNSVGRTMTSADGVGHGHHRVLGLDLSARLLVVGKELRSKATS
jgi:hypothetical protein